MGNSIDQVQDTGDANDQDNAEQQDEFRADAHDLTSEGNREIIDFYKSSVNDSIKVADSGTTSNSPRPDTSRELIADKINDLKTQDPSAKELSGVERAVNAGKVNSPQLQSEQAKKEFSQNLSKSLAFEMENMLVLDGLVGDPVLQAADRLRQVAGNDLPDNFDEQLTDWLAYQKRQRLGNEEAERLGLKDDDGNDLRFPCAENDQELADALNAFADGYEKNQRGELSGAAAEGYASKADFNYDWRSSLEMMLDPVGKDDQAQIGSCAMNTQLVAGWTKSPKEMAMAYMGGMTEGTYETPWGERINLNPDELGRGDTNGQEPCVYIGCSLLADAAYGQEHRDGNTIEAMDDALEVLTGYSVSSMDGAYHKLSPGHSMVALNVVHADGSFTKEQYNHWNQMGEGEPGEGLDYDYRHQIDLSRLKIG